MHWQLIEYMQSWKWKSLPLRILQLRIPFSSVHSLNYCCIQCSSWKVYWLYLVGSELMFGFYCSHLKCSICLCDMERKEQPTPIPYTKPSKLDSGTKQTIGEIKPTVRKRSESRVFPWLTTMELNKDKLAMAKAKKYNRDTRFWQ